MVFILRAIFVLPLGILICISGCIFSLLNRRNTNNVARAAHLFGRFLTPFFGVKIINRKSTNLEQIGNCIYIANHQDNYDVLVASNMFPPNTVTVGKKSLAWIPFFGQLYYLTGNILIDRENKAKARDTISQVVREIKERKISVWMFPEGTRSRGRGLLPFKTGAFRAAIAAGVPVVPICISDTTHFSPNRWHNGYAIVEILDPIETKGMTKENVRELMDHSYQIMSAKLKQLNEEVQVLNRNDKS